ncbi:MAG: M48 family metalloprotease [bacterium]|nr:M48 family metalloprotease [bacterium]
MKKKFLGIGLLCALSCTCSLVNATTLQQVNGNPATAQSITYTCPAYQYVDEIGFKILNANQIDKHIIFGVYSPKQYSPYLINDDVTVSYRTLYLNRRVLISDQLLAHVTSDDEVAALISHEIAHCLKSYTGVLRGSLHGLVYAFTAKKQNYDADKLAIELMAHAGYNPNALITILTKTAGQYRFDIGENPLTTKRIREINNYIQSAYPNTVNAYANNQVYKNAMTIIKPAEKNQNWKYYTQKVKDTTKNIKKDK